MGGCEPVCIMEHFIQRNTHVLVSAKSSTGNVAYWQKGRFVCEHTSALAQLCRRTILLHTKVSSRYHTNSSRSNSCDESWPHLVCPLARFHLWQHNNVNTMSVTLSSHTHYWRQWKRVDAIFSRIFSEHLVCSCRQGCQRESNSSFPARFRAIVSLKMLFRSWAHHHRFICSSPFWSRSCEHSTRTSRLIIDYILELFAWGSKQMPLNRLAAWMSQILPCSNIYCSSKLIELGIKVANSFSYRYIPFTFGGFKWRIVALYILVYFH